MIVPLGYCGACGQAVPGHTDRRYMLCRVKAGFHWHPRLRGLWCIGSNKLARVWPGDRP